MPARLRICHKMVAEGPRGPTPSWRCRSLPQSARATGGGSRQCRAAGTRGRRSLTGHWFGLGHPPLLQVLVLGDVVPQPEFPVLLAFLLLLIFELLGLWLPILLVLQKKGENRLLR